MAQTPRLQATNQQVRTVLSRIETKTVTFQNTVNNEGTVRDSNQTTQTAVRAGIGALVGAVIGAGAGAGSVLVTGRDSIELGPGSVFRITATAPAIVGVNR